MGSQAAGSCGAGWGPGQEAEKPAVQDGQTPEAENLVAVYVSHCEAQDLHKLEKT